MENFAQKYIQEANELLAKLEENILILEKNKSDIELIIPNRYQVY